MRSPLHARRRQKGAVAIVLGLSLVTLFAMGGVVLDLGHLYVAKSELQNAADAAALAGAKELKETADGITLAVSQAHAVALKNNYNFSMPVNLDDTNTSLDIKFSSTPDLNPSNWFTIAEAKASPQGKTFIKVDTGLKSMNTYLMRVVGPAFNEISTLGVAVAGRYAVDVTPMGVCAVDPATKGGVRPLTNELTEFGFRRGVSYNLPSLNPLGSPRDPIFINPLAYPGGPVACQGSQGSEPNTASALCTGTSASIPTMSGNPRVYVNTGRTVVLERALNSRFNAPAAAAPTSPCNAGTGSGSAPPDTNIKYYSANFTPPASNTPEPSDPITGSSGHARDWMEQTGVKYPFNTQTINITAQKPVDYPNLNPTAEKYGVLWSFNPAVQAVGASPNATAGAPFAPTNTNWANLYNNSALTFPSTANNLLDPSYPNTRSPYDAPYEKTTGNYSAPAAGGVKYRRVLNVVILDCAGYSGTSGICDTTLPVKGIGRFFMQVPANLNPGGGADSKIEAEFAGLVAPIPSAEIKLYR